MDPQKIKKVQSEGDDRCYGYYGFFIPEGAATDLDGLPVKPNPAWVDEIHFSYITPEAQAAVKKAYEKFRAEHSKVETNGKSDSRDA